MSSSTIRDADKLDLKIPNLREFRDKGMFSQGLRDVMPTVTFPRHTTMVTGSEPADHGIAGNELFDPEQRLNRAWYWYAESIKVPTLWDAVKSAGWTTAAVSWPVRVGARGSTSTSRVPSNSDRGAAHAVSLAGDTGPGGGIREERRHAACREQS